MFINYFHHTMINDILINIYIFSQFRVEKLPNLTKISKQLNFLELLIKSAFPRISVKEGLKIESLISYPNYRL